MHIYVYFIVQYSTNNKKLKKERLRINAAGYTYLLGLKLIRFNRKMLSTTQPQNNCLLPERPGRQQRAKSVGPTLGLPQISTTTPSGDFDRSPSTPNSPNKSERRPRSALGTSGSNFYLTDGVLKYPIRRRSTRRRLSQAQKAINFNQWSNKKLVSFKMHFKFIDFIN